MILELKTKEEIGTAILFLITSVINRLSDWQVVFFSTKNAFCASKRTCPLSEIVGGLAPKSPIENN